MKLHRIIFPEATQLKVQNGPGNKRLRLGEILIGKKLLTPDQVNDAIEAQQLYGSRFGTSLVELGYIDEETIAKVLSQKLNLPYIEPDALMNIPQDILAMIPQGLAKEHQVIPCECEGKKLYLAMADTQNLAVIDELSFRLNCIIAPVVVPEVRLMFALHKYYQKQLSPRLRALGQHLLDKKINRTQNKVSSWVDSPALRSSGSNLEVSKDAKVPPPDLAPASEPVEPAKPARPPAPIAPQPQPAKPVAPPIEEVKPSTLLPFDEFCTRLADAKDREATAEALLTFIGQEFHCGAVLTVKGNLATGWHAVLSGKPLHNFNQLAITLDQKSLLRQVVENKNYYIGPPETSEQDISLLQCFSNKIPETVMLVPLIIKNRLIGILYFQDKKEHLEERIAMVHQIAARTSMSFEILILRSKILIT
jgi:hypothetical protein